MLRPEHMPLLAALHRGGGQTPRWGDFLSQLRSRCAADEAVLAYAEANPSAGRLARWASPAAAGATAWPLERLQDLRPERVYAREELLSGPDFEAAPGHGRIVRVAQDDAWSAWLGIFRGVGDFSAIDAVLLSALAPHVAIAIGNFASIERERLRAAVVQDVLVRAGISWRLHAENGRLLDQGGPPWPNPRAPDEARTLAQAATAAPQILGSDEHCFLAGAAPQGATPGAAASVSLARAPRTLGAGHARRLERIYGLSAKEARLAIAVANGRSLSEAAVDLDLTTETARNYSKRIYAKTGARGLPDLVRLVWSSIIAIVGDDA